MANFKQVNFGKDTIWLDIDKVLYFYEPGEIITLDENYADLLEDWGIIRKA